MAEWLRKLIFNTLNRSSFHRCGYQPHSRHVRQAKVCLRVVRCFFFGGSPAIALHQNDGNNKSFQMLPELVPSECMPVSWDYIHLKLWKSAKSLSLPRTRCQVSVTGPLVLRLFSFTKHTVAFTLIIFSAKWGPRIFVLESSRPPTPWKSNGHSLNGVLLVNTKHTNFKLLAHKSSMKMLIIVNPEISSHNSVP